jgi:hypothetical protein
MSYSFWTDEQKNFLIENLGKLSYSQIGKRIGKTERAVRQKRVRMETERPINALDCVTIKLLARTIHASARSIKKWILQKGLKASFKKIESKRIISQIAIEDFWEWAKENQKMISWKEFKVGELGCEPKWTKEARRNCTKNRITWTTHRENLVESYYKLGMSPKQIGEKMNLSAGTIRTRHNLIKRRKKLEIIIINGNI